MPHGIDPVAVAFTILYTVNTALLGLVLLTFRTMLRGGLIPKITYDSAMSSAVTSAAERVADTVTASAARVADATEHAQAWRAAAADWSAATTAEASRVDVLAAQIRDLTEAVEALTQIHENGIRNVADLIRARHEGKAE